MQQLNSNNMGLGLTSTPAAASVTATSTTNRPVIMGALTLVAGRGLGTTLQVATWDLNWGSGGYPLSVFGLNSGLFEDNFAGISFFTGQDISITANLDAPGVIGGGWAVDDLQSDAQALAQAKLMVKNQQPPGRINWVFGLGEIAVPAGATRQVLTATAKRDGIGPGMLCLDIAGAPAVGDLQLVDVQIEGISQMPSSNPIDALALQAGNFNRAGFSINRELTVNTPVSLFFANPTGAPITVSAAFLNPATRTQKLHRAGLT